MSEEKKNDIFSKRTNQFGSLKKKQKENKEDVNSFKEKDFINEEEIFDDISNEDNSSDYDFCNEQISSGSLLDQFLEDSEDSSEDIIQVQDEELELNNNYEEETDNNSFDNVSEPIFEDISIGDDFEDATEEFQISIEDEELEDNSDNSMMGSILEELDSELNKQSLNLQNELVERFNEANETNESEDLDIPENHTSEPTENFNDFYTNEELTEQTKHKNNSNTKDLIIKIGVGIAAIIVIALIAVFISKIINKDLNSSGTNSNINESQSSEDISNNENNENTDNDINTDIIVDDIIGDISSSIIEEEIPDNSESITIEVPENDSFVKDFQGYIVDIKDDSIILSDLPYDKYLFLLDAFDEFRKKNPEEVNVKADEKNKKYHSELCECKDLPKDLSIITLKEATENEYTAETCALEVGYDALKDPKDFDYESYPELRGIVFTRIAITDDSNISLNKFTIGVESIATYFQDTESFLNELIELKPVKGTVDTSPDEGSESEDDKNNSNKTEKENDKESEKGVNVWGEEWNKIVGTINDRREDENKTNSPNKNDNQIQLGTPEKYESVSTTLEIGAASIVWFKINWKANSDVSNVPDAEDVTVELLTPNGSLINKDNIDKYGKLWVDEATGMVNIVIKNTIAGKYDIVFTKNVGTYLGDVTINAIPVTGFIELEAADAVYTNGKLEVIWNAVGVVDDNCLVEVYAVNGNKKVLLYSANSIDDGIHTVDMTSINVAKIAGNTYDIIIKVTDIDVTANKPYKISAKYLSDSVTIKNIEIPSFN